MFPRISDLINYLLGTGIDLPVQTYGFFLATAFLVAAWILQLELKRKEKEGFLSARTVKQLTNKAPGIGELVVSIIFTYILAWKFIGIVIHYQSFKVQPQQFLLSGQGSIPAGLAIVAAITGYFFYKRHKLKGQKPVWEDQVIRPYQNTWNILIVAVVAALIGSKIFDIMDNFGNFLNNPARSILSFSGLTFYGGFIVTVFTLLWYMKVIKLDWKYVIDAAAPAIMIGYAVGRMGCHLAGDGCWGIPNTMPKPEFLSWLPGWLWAFDYPHNTINHGTPLPGCKGPNCMVLESPVFPTPLYESMVSLLWFGILWISRKKIKAPVVLFGLFLVMNGLERFFIEKIRVNNRFGFLGMEVTQAEIISSLLFILGIAIILWFGKRHQNASKILKP